MICLTIPIYHCLIQRKFRLDSTSNSELQGISTSINTITYVEQFYDCARACSEKTCLAFTYTKKDSTCKTYNASFDISGNVNLADIHQNFNLMFCPTGWHSLKLVCFFVSKDSTSWVSAKPRCEQLGGNLAKISNSEENAFVKQLLGINEAWIGGNDLEEEGTFTWIQDNTRFVYTDWGPRQPNNYRGQHCVHIYIVGGQLFWADSRCSLSKRYICSMHL